MKASTSIRLSLAALTFAALGCVSLTPIREKRFEDVTMRQIEAAAGSDETAVVDGLVALLEKRLRKPSDVDIDLALEAIVSLMEVPEGEAIAITRRCAREDPAEDVRYVAIDLLDRHSREESRGLLTRVAESDESNLVRAHARKLLDRWK